MNQLASLVRHEAAATPSAPPRPRVGDDAQLLKIAAGLTRELSKAKAGVYWGDMLASAALGYTALYVAIHAAAVPIAILAGVVAILGLYRAGSFIHELTHVKHRDLPGFRLGWNLLVGIPLFIPSFMYEGVHNLHHAKTRYGTVDDPEYLPLALMKPWTLPLFLLASTLAPLALLVRFALLTPLSLLSPRLRALVVSRYSGLQINPAFRRRAAEGELRRAWLWQEAGASLWSIALLTAVATGFVPLRSFFIFIAIASGTMLLNQVRTLVAHLWENDGDPMSVTAQYLDSVNVPPPGSLPALWAPVGLRYHALHHLLPSVPYHALAEAHRRLCAELDATSPYHRASHRGLVPLASRLATSSWRGAIR